MAILTVFIISMITFFAMNAIPGGPFNKEKASSPAVIATLEARYNLDKPVPVQYVLYMKKLLSGDLGVSLKNGREIKAIIGESFPISAKLGLLASVVAIILGIVLFFTQIRLPVIFGNTMSQISATLGPVCMIMLGMTMTEVKWKDIFSHSRIYLITILKMVVTPLIVLLLLKYLPLASLVKDGKTILLISLMAVITPSATTIVQLAQLYDREPVYASTINVMTTLVSIVTMPLMVMFYLA